MEHRHSSSYLLLVVRCVGQHGGDVEHYLIVFVGCVQRVGSSGVSYSSGKITADETTARPGKELTKRTPSKTTEKVKS